MTVSLKLGVNIALRQWLVSLAPIPDRSVRVEFRAGFGDLLSQWTEHTTSTTHPSICVASLNCGDLSPKAVASRLNPSGGLDLRYEFSLIEPVVYKAGKKQADNLHLPQGATPSLNLDLGRLFVDQRFSDFTIACGRRSFSCHRCVLSARSPVFAAMLEHDDTEEGRSREVRVTDVEPEVMDGLLRFVYTDRCPRGDTRQLYNLMVAADKYDIRALKDICQDALSQSIEVRTYVYLCANEEGID